MKTTLDIADAILLRAKTLAREQNITLRSLVEEGLTQVIEDRERRKSVRVNPVTFRGNGLSDEFRRGSWSELRNAAYEGRGT